MSAGLFGSLGTTDALAEAFSDRSVLRAMLAFEVALARAEAKLHLIPHAAAAAIEAAADPDAFDAGAIARAARSSGTITIPFVEQLTARVRATSPDAAAFVHRGATSQDVSDTALVLCVARAAHTIQADHTRLLEVLRGLSAGHATTVMLARTLLQPAAPTTFGLKAAGWFGAVARAGTRLFDAFADAGVLQFGGAAGTLAALGTDGPAVASEVAAQLKLRAPEAPWHVHRDRLAWLVAACGVYTGGLGKIARDVSLLMQFEVAEASEPGGSSSTMPHKRNPAGCAVVLAAAARVPGLVATCLSGLVQEHERGVGNWHAEAETISSVVQTTGAALAAMMAAIQQLQVDPVRMRANLDATRGVIYAEAAMIRLTPVMGKSQADEAIRTAMQAVQHGGANFVESLLANEAVRAALEGDRQPPFGEPESYLGAAEQFRRRLLDTRKE